ncbi:ABC transporter ATP-binding protein [Frankia sp. AgPm24]|uniref:ABC transporter ATP-binding protein n=1 Tax=Frankia umida TaxID=573489 RepID=A0ABT0K002_9ACTN|nr:MULTISPECIES: ABC transporter ATP-binding protein [Frankia]MCK9877123.1 ABC transporter ATP-binding protein [Frankia umida]MCK9925096.1 ABC transporter ATP-binding protein [Frankia sp. AgPm24]
MAEPNTTDTAPAPVLLKVDDLHVTIGGGATEAVHGVSFEVRRGEAIGIVGESGSGKTLVCRSVLGVLAPGCAVSGGSIDLDGTQLVGLPRRAWDQLRGTGIAAVFQDPASYLNPSYPVGRQVAEQLRVKLGASRRDARTTAVQLLASMGLHDPERVYRQYPHELSGGMLQRVVLAIAVCGDPALLIADEATTALDVTIQAEVLDLLASLRAERGLSIIAVSHDLAVIAELCDRVLVFYAGELVEAGPTAEVLLAPRHPYTEALLQVASVGSWERRTLAVIDGQPPPVGATIAGCRFADRCAFATTECRTSPVPLTDQPDGRSVRCLRVEEIALQGTGAAAGAGVA